MAVFSLIHTLCSDNAVAFDYARPRNILSGVETWAFDAMQSTVERAGEPFRTFFDRDALAVDLKEIGFRRVERPTTDQINKLYFHNRVDGLRVRGQLAGLMCAYQLREGS